MSLTNSTSSAKTLPDIYPADVSSIVKAVWTLSSALKIVQRRSCRRGTDCLLYLRRSLSSYVARAAAGIDQIVDYGSENLKRIRLNFDKDGSMTSTKYGLRGFTLRGDIKEVSNVTSLLLFLETKSNVWVRRLEFLVYDNNRGLWLVLYHLLQRASYISLERQMRLKFSNLGNWRRIT